MRYPMSLILFSIEILSKLGAAQTQHLYGCYGLDERARSPQMYPNNTIVDTLFMNDTRPVCDGHPVLYRECNFFYEGVTLIYFLPTTVLATVATVFEDIVMYGTQKKTSTRVLTVPEGKFSSSLNSVASALVPEQQKYQAGDVYLGWQTVELIPGGTLTTNRITVIAPIPVMVVPFIELRATIGCDISRNSSKSTEEKNTICYSAPDPTYIPPFPMPTNDPSIDYRTFHNEFYHEVAGANSWLRSVYPALSGCVRGEGNGSPAPKVVVDFMTLTQAGTTTSYPQIATATYSSGLPPIPPAPLPITDTVTPIATTPPANIPSNSPPTQPKTGAINPSILPDNVLTRSYSVIPSDSSLSIPSTVFTIDTIPIIAQPGTVIIGSSIYTPGGSLPVVHGTTIVPGQYEFMIQSSTIRFPSPEVSGLLQSVGSSSSSLHSSHGSIPRASLYNGTSTLSKSIIATPPPSNACFRAYNLELARLIYVAGMVWVLLA